jgi:site-specific DNA recombinase
MSPSHAAKGERRWRYYVSQAILQGRKQEAGSVARVPVPHIEHRVTEALRPHLFRIVSSRADCTALSEARAGAARPPIFQPRA